MERHLCNALRASYAQQMCKVCAALRQDDRREKGCGMATKQAINKLEGQYNPTILQSAMGSPLRSEQRTGEFLPRVLSRVDMLIIFIAIVLFIPNASIVQATQGAGFATYLYWVIGAVTFLLPGAV